LLLPVALPGAAQACTIPPPTHWPTPAEVDDAWQARYRSSASAVEVAAVGAPVPGRVGEVRVLRVYKGGLRPGAVLQLGTTAPGFTCGGGGFFGAGSRGILLLPARGPFRFEGYLPPDAVSTLRRAGLLPRN
jgi:hypothetical protein